MIASHSQEEAEPEPAPETVGEVTSVPPIEEHRPDLAWAYAPTDIPLRALKVNNLDFTDLTGSDDVDFLNPLPVVGGYYQIIRTGKRKQNSNLCTSINLCT